VLSKLPLKLAFCEGDDQPEDPRVTPGGADVVGKWYFHAHEAEIVQCDELRQKTDVSKGLTTKHIEFDVKNFPAMQWKTADNLEILPSNTEEDVELFAQFRRAGYAGPQADFPACWTR
jgi:sulfite reductase alpha subunit-like flavoprotein